MLKYLGKRWLKRKGCKNVAIVSYGGKYEDGETFIQEYVQPYHEGREFRYVSPEISWDKPKTYMENCYFTEEGMFKIINSVSS